MSLSEDNKKANRTSSIARVMSFIMLVVLMVLIAYIVYLKSNNIDIRSISIMEIFKGNLLVQGSDKKINEVIQIEYNPKDHPSFAVYKGYIVKCIDDNVKFVDKSGETVWEKTLAVNDPIIKTNGTELLIAGTGSKEIYLIKDKELKWSYKFDNNIINANLSEGGYVAVVHEAKGFKGAATVFNLQGTPFFTRNVAEGFVITAGVSSKAKQVVINSLETNGVKSVTSIELTDMLGKPVASKVQFADTLFPSIWYLKDEAVAAVSDTKVVYLNREGKTIWEAPFLDKEILTSGNLDGSSIVVALDDIASGGVLSEKTTRMLTISSEGKQNEICSVEGTAKNITISGDIIAVNTGSNVHFTNSRGKLLGKYTPKVDINEVKFLNSDEAVVITKNSIAIVKVQR